MTQKESLPLVVGMSDNESMQQQTQSVSLFLKAESLPKDSPFFSIEGIKRISENEILVEGLEGVSFIICRKSETARYLKEIETHVVSFYYSLLNADKNISFDIISKFLKFQEPALEVLLGTKNKVLVETETDEVELVSDGFLKKSLHSVFEVSQHPESELSVLDCIFIKFNNAELIRLSDVLRHPYFLLLPWTLIESKPTDEETFPVLWRKQALRADISIYESEDHFVSSFIQSLPSLVQTQKLKVFLVEKPYDDRGYSLSYTGVFRVSPEIKSMVVKPVLFESAQMTLVDRVLKLDVDYAIDLSKARMMDSLFHLKETAELFITKEDEIREGLKNIFSADKIKFQLKSLAFQVSEDSLKSKVSYEDSFYKKPMVKIKSLEKLFPVKIQHDLNVRVIEPKSLTLNFSSVESSKVELKYPHLNLDPSSFLMTKTLQVLLGIKGGVAGYLGKDAANIAVKGNKRLLELKLLKSSGFFSYLLIEVIQATKASSELNIEELWAKLDIIILKLSGEEALNTETLVSSFFIEYVNECITDLFDRGSYEILQVLDAEVAIMSSQKTTFDFIEPLLSNLTSYFKGKTFILDNFQNFEINPSQSFSDGLSLILQSPCPLKIGKFINRNNCIVNDEKVRILKETSFKADLKVVEQASSKSKIDWFELDPKYYFDGVEISEEEAKAFQVNSLVRHNGQVYFIPEKDVPVVKWLNYFWDRVSLDKKSGADNKDAETNEPTLYRSHILDILALRQAGIPVEGGARWQEIAKEYDSL